MNLVGLIIDKPVVAHCVGPKHRLGLVQEARTVWTREVCYGLISVIGTHRVEIVD
jgi:hypothetical protein